MRNPLDNFVSTSVFHQVASHSLQALNNMNEEFPDYWDGEVERLCNWWSSFYDVSMRTTVQHVPTLAVRYEDLILCP